MKRFLVAFAILWSVRAVAQKHPNIELGFNSDRLYQFSDLDSVNLYNGNLILTVPIGPRFTVNAFSYQFSVLYNSKVWDYDGYTPPVSPLPDAPPPETYTYAYPNWRSNAGTGWRLSFGRLIEPGDGLSWFNDTSLWKYEDASGAEHAFGPSDRDESGSRDYNDDTVLLSTDQSAIRMVKRGESSRDLEFPSGEVHHFEFDHNRWRLRKISDRFGNYLQITSVWDSENRESQWTLEDSLHRQHHVTFAYYPGTQGSFDAGQHVQTIVMDSAAGVGPGSPPFAGASLTYSFNVQPRSVAWGCGSHPYETIPDRATMPLLTSIVLPDSTSFQFGYRLDVSDACSQGSLTSMTLPTKGRISYEYQLLLLPEAFCDASPVTYSNPAVKRKSVVADPSVSITAAVTDYVYSLSPNVDYERAHACESCGCYTPVPGAPAGPTPQPLYRWARTTVLSPVVDGKRVRNDSYFYTWNTDIFDDTFNPPLTNGPEKVVRFGQSITTAAPSDAQALQATAPDEGAATVLDNFTHYLSTRTFERCPPGVALDCTGGRLLRSTHLKFPADGAVITKFYPVESTVTKFHDAAVAAPDTGFGCSPYCWVKTTNGLGDGIHEYRLSTTTTNFPEGGGFSVRTDYRVWTPDMVGAMSPQQTQPANEWLLNVFGSTMRQEGSDTATAEYCFAADGFLNGVRTWAEAARRTYDSLTLFSGSQGNVEWEKTFGGSANSASLASACGTTTSTPKYLTANAYANGTFVKSDACVPQSSESCSSILTTQHIDAHRTGVPTASYDAADVKTEYTYDSSGRLATISPEKPADGPTISYAYDAATDTSRAKVTETMKDGAVTLKETLYEFDGLGRVARATSSLPDGKRASVETKYDDLGRKSEVTQPFDADAPPSVKPSTRTSFDALGRPLEITSPDGKVLRFEYLGDQLVRRISKVAMSTSATESDAVVTELYDAQHRLKRVIENSKDTSAGQPVGGRIETVYGYDVGGRLKRVETVGAAAQAPRTFTYDFRGFLLSESSPESGPTTYASYDARGHAGSRTSGGKTLAFTYDVAERLTDVRSDVLLKHFEFGSANAGTNLLKGKLFRAFRRNDLESAGRIDVTESYTYAGPAGRMSNRNTLIEQVSTTDDTVRATIQQSDYAVISDKLGLTAAISTMPTCQGCTTMPGLASVVFTHSAGYLVGVTGFAKLTYDPAGIVHSVQHGTATPAPTDTYDSDSGLARPKKITLAGVSSCPPPTIQASDAICAGATGTASVQPVAGTTYSWTIAGGSINSGTNSPTITFQAGTSGTITLTLQAAASCATTTATKSVAVGTIPAPSDIAAPAAVCANSSGHTASVPSRSGISHQWTITGGNIVLPNGQFATTAAGDSISFKAATGTVTLSVTATNTCGGTATSTKQVPITGAPTAALSADAAVNGEVIVIRGSTTVQLIVTLTGPGPWEIGWRDGLTETATTSPYYRSVSPASSQLYVIDSLTCGSCTADPQNLNASIYVRVIPPAPAWVQAATEIDGRVKLTWANVPGAAKYRIERRTLFSSASPEALFSNVVAPPFYQNVPATATPVTYIYHVRAMDSDNSTSNMGAYDYVTGGTTLWSQNIIAGQTIIRPQDIQELRNAVDAFRVAFGWPRYFSAMPPTGAVTAATFTEIISKFDQARAGKFPPFTYVNVTNPLPNGVFRAEHIIQLRKAMD